ncbi:MAG: bifunctional 4-hydroxy-2-oxoglutarate aldolase/2-dehydro-3-deoxy-phosphogluconate aldolase [Bryobacteraceae bacterium]|jgi:2-dehydro-3-deoxyphosphogluconate aldolase/(4S)-4-hydroxy-2-oxoglutarate aldolase
MTRADVHARILRTGVIPAIRTASADDALFAADAVHHGGIHVVELTMTVPGAHEVLIELRRTHPKLMVGAGTVLDVETARSCVDAGAAFLSSPGLEPSVLNFAAESNVAVIPGALTPSEVMMALKAGADFIKVFPCAAVGGPSYIRALKAPFPNAPLMASGGVNQVTAKDYLSAGAVVLGIRGELIPHQAIERRNAEWIHELASRFLNIVKQTRAGRES